MKEIIFYISKRFFHINASLTNDNNDFDNLAFRTDYMNTTSTYTDEDIMVHLKADNDLALNELALSTLIERYRKLLLMTAFYHLEDHQDAQDIVQDTFICLWSKRKTLEISKGIKSYLTGIVRIKCMDILRSRKRQHETKLRFEQECQSPLDTKMTTVEIKELAVHLDTAITNLSPARRNAFIQKYKDQKSTKEIADMMNIQKQAVKNHISEAIRRLRKDLQYVISNL
jgi:RNA polymerase sigma-70 factor (family 1)